MSVSDANIRKPVAGERPFVEIDQDKCKGCDICLNLCPKHVFTESGEIGARGFKMRLVKADNECSDCGLCQYFCPESAIKLKETSIIDEIWERTRSMKKSVQGRGGWKKSKTLHPGKHFLSGNIACAWAALDAGCRFFAGYPITPASEQSYEMERSMPAVQGVFVQMENEDASMAALIGASLAGAKPMTATSDPGFERMLENLSYALVNELPMVISLVQRTSPSTGRPTGTGSWLIRGTRWGPHGGTEHIVLYPSTVQDIYDDTVRAFNLSEKFRVPAIVMMEASNAHLEESVEIPEEIDVFDRVYLPGKPPFGPTPDTSAPSMPRFGDGEEFKVTGLTHNEWGVPVAESPIVHERLVKHLRQKIESHVDELLSEEEYLLDDADMMIVAFGHTARASRWAIQEARKAGIRVGMLNIRTLYPFPEAALRQWTQRVTCVLVPEMNQGQLFYVVREDSFAPVLAMTQPDGENIDPKRILRFIHKIHGKYRQETATVHTRTIFNPPEWEKEAVKQEPPDSSFKFQTPFCPGCGLGILRNCLLKSIEELDLPSEKLVFASGIGCTARLPNHVPFDSANTTHGYPVPFVTGVKLAQPDLKPIVVSGDGDLFDIGAGHSIHGARRNLPMTVICINNFVFGMTGGQVSSTTPFGAITSTSTKGNVRRPFDLMKLMLGANVKFAARCPVSRPLVLKKMIKEALAFNGFAFIEVITPCVTGYGRRNGIASAAEITQKLNQTYVNRETAGRESLDFLKEKYRLMFPFREDIPPEELLQVVYGQFGSLQEYMNVVAGGKV